MGHEISQFDIPDRQLLASNAQPREGVWMDIGEAKITRTILGRAKVRVIREQDKKRRARLLAALVVMAVAAAAWQGWIASQQTEPLAVPPLPLGARIRVSAPTFQPEDSVLPATPPSERKKPGMPSQTAINNLAISRKSASQQPHGLKPKGRMAAKSALQPMITSKPESFATNNNSSKNQTDKQRLPVLSSPIQPAAPTLAIPPVTQSAANRPAAVTSLVEPLIKEDISTQSPTGNNQPSGSDNAQP